MIFNLELIAVYALASAAISFTITTTSIFTWLRDVVISLKIQKLEELIHCPWCLSHYITVFLLLISGQYKTFVSFLILFFAVQGIIGLLHYVMLRAYEPVMKSELQRKLDKKFKKN
jgi:hypothetical protein